jgi:hypothetical protein
VTEPPRDGRRSLFDVIDSYLGKQLLVELERERRMTLSELISRLRDGMVVSARTPAGHELFLSRHATVTRRPAGRHQGGRR